ncbi:ComF family protein [Motilimonas pumila]|uniref:ComF family protein n=1 Tax=Motilimonas pumila TaxID=2303987 RepID=A0A418YKT4_9GAMM|nr:ComF family protein [Motilimonas pumila]RJG51583.1 ComF family protein [Motilimonas pumila]
MLTQPIFDASTKLLQWLEACLPLSCLLCQQGITQGLVCSTCQQDLLQCQHYCLQCGYLLQDPHCQRCGPCSHDPKPVILRHGGLLQPPLNQMIYRLKYDKQALFAPILAQLLYQQLRSQTPTSWPQVLIPTPLHPIKQWQRGFNQASLLALALSKQLSIPVHHSLCKKVKHTPSQTQLSKPQRKQNMQHAFRCQRHDYQRLAIIDDIYTTGSTSLSLAKAITAQACYPDVTIEIWTIARTDLQCSH